MEDRHYKGALAQLGAQRPLLLLLNVAFFAVALIGGLWGDRAAMLAPVIFGLVTNGAAWLEDQRKLSEAIRRDAEGKP